MIRPALLIICLFAVRIISAQNTGSISGKIADSLQRPLEGATVLLVTGTGVTIKTALSDHKGSFALEKIKFGTYKLIASMTGFRKDSINAVVLSEEKNNLNLGTISLVTLPRNLEGVTVTSQRPAIERKIRFRVSFMWFKF